MCLVTVGQPRKSAAAGGLALSVMGVRMTKTAIVPNAGAGRKSAAGGFAKRTGSRSAATVKPVRITVDLPPVLHRRVKIEALNQGKAMTDLIREWIETNCKP